MGAGWGKLGWGGVVLALETPLVEQIGKIARRPTAIVIEGRLEGQLTVAIVAAQGGTGDGRAGMVLCAGGRGLRL